jgi:polysaccharide export outer membrane protein
MMTAFRHAWLALLVILLASCTSPRGAGFQSEVLRGSDSADIGYSVYPVTRALIPTLAEWPSVGEKRMNWITTSTGSIGQVVRPGDEMRITVWDSSENSLLTTAGGRFVQLPNMVVSPSGSVFLPYVGDVRIGGLSPQAARARLQSAMEPIAPSAQVQISVEAGRGNAVELIGGVSSPGAYPLPDRNFTVLSLIAAGGGVDDGLLNPQVRLKRNGQLYGTSIDRLYDEPRLDTLLTDGDQVIVESDDRSFIAVGAAQDETIHVFPTDIVTAAQAVSIIGGVLDSRANPKGVLILREYPREALTAGLRGPRTEQVVFAVDLTNADGLFAARNFRIAPDDMVYVTESPLPSTNSVFGVVGTAFGLGARVGILN